MPGRVLFVLIATLGLMVLVVLLARGWDARRAAESGPQWRRNLVCAALFLLACLGCSSGGKSDLSQASGTQPSGNGLEQPAGADSPRKPVTPIMPSLPQDDPEKLMSPEYKQGAMVAETQQWKYVSMVWNEATRLVALEKEGLLLDHEGHGKLLTAIRNARNVVCDLEATDRMFQSEVDFLKLGLAELQQQVGSLPTTKNPVPEPQEPIPPFSPKGLERLRERLALARSLAERGFITPSAVRKLRPLIEDDLRLWSSIVDTKGLEPALQAEIKTNRHECERALTAIRKELSTLSHLKLPPADLLAEAVKPVKAGQSLEETPQWRLLTLIWREAEATATFKYGQYPYDSEDKAALILSIRDSLSGIARLTEAGMITEPEAELFTTGLEERLRELPYVQAYENRLVSCYAVATIGSSPQKSLARLKHRVPILKKLALEGTINRSVMAVLQPTIQDDLSQLRAETEIEAVKIRKEGAAVLDLIEKPQKPIPPPALPPAELRVQALAPVKDGLPLQDTPQWKYLSLMLPKVEDMLRGKRGDYPFNKSGQEALVKACQDCMIMIEKLKKSAKLPEVEAEYLSSCFTELSRRIGAQPPVEVLKAENYRPVSFWATPEDLERIRKLKPLVLRLGSSKSLHHSVMERILSLVEADVRTLSSSLKLSKLTPALQQEATDLLRIYELAAKLPRKDDPALMRAMLPPAELVARAEKSVVAEQPLEETPQWEFVLFVWHEAEATLDFRRGLYPFDEQGQTAMLESLRDAVVAVERLRMAGTITAPEAAILNGDLRRLEKDIPKIRTTEQKSYSCYLTSRIPSDPKSCLTRLQNRMHFFRELIDRGTVTAAVLEKALPSIEQDLKQVDKALDTRLLPETFNTEARKVREQYDTVVTELKRLLEKEVSTGSRTGLP